MNTLENRELLSHAMVQVFKAPKNQHGVLKGPAHTGGSLIHRNWGGELPILHPGDQHKFISQGFNPGNVQNATVVFKVIPNSVVAVDTSFGSNYTLETGGRVYHPSQVTIDTITFSGVNVTDNRQPLRDGPRLFADGPSVDKLAGIKYTAYADMSAIPYSISDRTGRIRVLFDK